MPARPAASTIAAMLLAVGCFEPAPALAAGARRPFICTAEDTDLARWRRERAWRSNPDAVPIGRGTAFPADAWRPSDGRTPNTGVITLGVHFVNGSSAQKALVRRLVPEWTEGAVGRRLKLRFDAPRDRSDIRIRFDASGDSSEVGRQALKIPKDRATMTFKAADRRAVLHEFGHALGLKHEHLHPRNGIRWNERALFADLTPVPWSEAKVRANILDKAPAKAACLGDPAFNRNSIMIYPIQSHWTLNGFSTPEITAISKGDRRCLESLY